MNYAAFKGHVTKEPEVRYAQTQRGEQMAIASYTVAVNRPGQDAGTDFIYCKALGKNGEFAEKYLHKGTAIIVEGAIRVDSYKDKDGNNRTSTYVQVNRHEFCEKKVEGHVAPAPQNNAVADGFMNIPYGLEEELPFN